MRGLVWFGCAAILMASTSASAKDNSASVEPVPTEEVQPDAVAALKRMSTYLGTLKTFELTSNSTLDVVNVHDQRLQLDAVVKYKVTYPGIWIDYDSDLKKRQYFYNGKQFTLYSPELKFYATMPAPPTNREFLKLIYDKFGISLPLEDLFRWADGDESDIKALTSGFSVGTATIDGARTDHWAFRQGDYDWEVWIEQGERPLPRKLVIINRTEPAMPAYSARLTWTLNPSLTAKDFTFVPTSGVSLIEIATFSEDK